MRKWMRRAARASRPDLQFTHVKHPGVRRFALRMRREHRQKRARQKIPRKRTSIRGHGLPHFAVDQWAPGPLLLSWSGNLG
jgi:hypothetical protein